MGDPARRGRWVRMLGVLAVVVVALCGALAVWHVGLPGARPEPRVVADPVTVREGDAFRTGAFEIRSGWRLRSHGATLATDGITVQNISDGEDFPSFDVTLVDDGTTVGTVSCLSAGIEPGETFAPQCLSSDDVPPRYDEIVVVDTHTP